MGVSNNIGGVVPDKKKLKKKSVTLFAPLRGRSPEGAVLEWNAAENLGRDPTSLVRIQAATARATPLIHEGHKHSTTRFSRKRSPGNV